MTASLVSHVTPRLSSGLLRQLPTRFFGGLPATIQELLQNALRAGATTVDFTLDGPVLRVTDNGRGLHDPQLLMTAGESGWGEEVINPAGLGALSVLNPDFATHARYRSQGWAVDLTPEDFATERRLPVQDAPEMAGFEVSVTFKDVPDLKPIIAERRGYAPVTVRFQGEEIPAKVPQGTAIDTPVGTLWYSPSTYATDRASGIWEFFATGARDVYTRMSRLDPVIQAFVAKHHLTWQIDPACGVRPKLPDRTELIENQALDHAARTLSRCLLDLITSVYTQHLDLNATQLDPERIRSAQHLFTPDVLRAFLVSRGYTESVLSRPDNAGMSIYFDTNDNVAWGWDSTWVHLSQPLVHALTAGEQVALNYLRELGAQPAMGTRHLDAPAPAVTARRPEVFLELSDTWNDPIAVAALSPELTLNGVSVPFLLTTIETDTFTGTALVLRGTPSEAESFLRTHQDVLGGVLLMEMFSHFPTPETVGVDEGDFTAGDLGRMLLTRFIGQFFPERAQAQATVETLAEKRNALSSAVRAMTRVTGLLPDDAYAACLGQLQAHVQTHDAEIQALIHEHHLQ